MERLTCLTQMGMNTNTTINRKRKFRFESFEPKELVEHVSKTVVGQEQFLQKVAETLRLSSLRMTSIKRGEDPSKLPRVNSFVVLAPTGSGKTFGIETLLKELNLEHFEINAASLTGEGYRGLNPSEALQGVGEWQEDNPNKVCVVIFDEADKMAKNDSNAAGFNPTDSLLKFLEPGKHRLGERHGSDQTKMLDSDRIVFIFLGAFSKIHNVVLQRLEKAASNGGYGFTAASSEDFRNLSEEKLRDMVTLEDLAVWGFPRELIGRMGEVINIPSLTFESLKKIVKGSDASIEKRFSKLFNFPIVIEDDAADYIAKAALAAGKGARGLEDAFRQCAGEIADGLQPDIFVNKVTVKLVEDKISLEWRTQPIKHLTVNTDNTYPEDVYSQEGEDASLFNTGDNDKEDTPNFEKIPYESSVLEAPTMRLLRTSEGIEMCAKSVICRGNLHGEENDKTLKLAVNYMELAIYYALHFALQIGSKFKPSQYRPVFTEETILALAFDWACTPRAPKDYDTSIASVFLDDPEVEFAMFPIERACLYSGKASRLELMAIKKCRLYLREPKDSRYKAQMLVVDRIEKLNSDPVAIHLFQYDMKRLTG